MKKPTDKQLEDLWKQVIKARANNECEYAIDVLHPNRGQCKGYLHAHHIAGKSTLSLKTSIYNGICLCTKHHLYVAHEQRGVSPKAQALRKFAMELREIDEDFVKVLGNQVGTVDHWGMAEYLKQKIQEFDGINKAPIYGARKRRMRGMNND